MPFKSLAAKEDFLIKVKDAFQKPLACNAWTWADRDEQLQIHRVGCLLVEVAGISAEGDSDRIANQTVKYLAERYGLLEGEVWKIVHSFDDGKPGDHPTIRLTTSPEVQEQVLETIETIKLK